VKRSHGFTLIELMIVIAIIAILAGILIPNFLHARAQSQTASCEGNERQIAAAIEIYAVDHGGQIPASGPVDANMFGGAGNVYMAVPVHDPVTPALTYNYTTVPGPECNAAGLLKYEIIDNGNHDPTTTGSVPNAAVNATTVVYCSGSGLTAK
jgi:prepilin-type N-terminal cleavage/methylation domain-containing protein